MGCGGQVQDVHGLGMQFAWAVHGLCRACMHGPGATRAWPVPDRCRTMHAWGAWVNTNLCAEQVRWRAVHNAATDRLAPPAAVISGF